MAFYNVYAVDINELIDFCNDADAENQICDDCGWYNDECHCEDDNDNSLDEDCEDE
jgi:hypothetical protein